MKIIFYGTPQFAVASLEKIIENGFEVVAVVTAPDKPAGRGMQLHQSDVKVCALKHAIPVLQPVNLKSEAFLNTDTSIQAELAFVNTSLQYRTYQINASVWSRYE